MTAPDAGLRRRHGHSAFARADRADAKRGHPEASLQEWAAGRDLRLREPEELPAFAAGLPAHPEYVHELAHGTLPGGREGILHHELLQTHWGGDESLPGGFWSVRVTSQASLRRALTPGRSDLPFLGWLFEAKTDEQPDAAFGTTGAWAPCTRVALRVPEAAHGPALSGGVASRVPSRRGDHDFGRYRVHAEGRDPGAIGAVRLPVLRTALDGIDAPYVEFGREAGVAWVRCNGYLTDPGRLDALLRAGAAAADALAVS